MTQYNSQRKLLLLLAVCLMLISTYSVSAQGKKLSISGFTETSFETHFGDPADAEDLEKYEDAGGEDEAVEETNRVTMPGFNLIVTSQLSDNLTFQGEIVNSFEEGDFEVELLRAYADYKINPNFNLQAGKFLTPIGYLNRNQRFYGYLNYSVEQRNLVNKELGYVPLSTVGLKAYGTFGLGNTSSLTYHVGIGGMRGLVPEGSETLSSFEWGEDESNSPGVNGLLEYLTYIGNNELIIGVSGYSIGRIVGFAIEDGEEIPFGEEDEDEEEEEEEEEEADFSEMELSEVGFVPYIRIDGPKFQFLAEYHTTTFTDELGNLEDSKFDYEGYSLELVFKTKLAKKSFYPYIRFDGSKIAREGYHPYFGLELESADELEKAYVPSSQELLFGAAWDVIPGNRIKMEYGRFIEGPFPANTFRISTAFAF